MIRRVNRHELADNHWRVVEPLAPRPHHMGRPPRDRREMLGLRESLLFSTSLPGKQERDHEPKLRLAVFLFSCL